MSKSSLIFGPSVKPEEVERVVGGVQKPYEFIEHPDSSGGTCWDSSSCSQMCGSSGGTCTAASCGSTCDWTCASDCKRESEVCPDV